jgi:phosphohistidine phosphatase
MKSLTLIRHAKAERPEEYPVDFDRPLTDRGLKDASRITAALAKLEPSIDLLVSSPAMRTRQTSERIARGLPYAKPIIWEERIYEASADHLLAILSNTPQDIQHLLLVGHNPGMEELVTGLTAGTTTSLNVHMPTAALAHLQLEIFWWNQIRWGCGQLHLLITPKVLRK